MSESIADLALSADEVKMMEESDNAEETAPETPTEEPAPVEEAPAEEPVAEAPPPQEDPKEAKAREIADNLHRALREERENSKAMKQKLAMLDEIKEQLRLMKEPPKPIEPEVKYDEDPLAWQKQKLEQIENAQKLNAEQIHRQEQNSEMVRFQNHVSALEADFRKSAPDYDKAVEYLLNVRKGELEEFGATPEQIQMELAQNAANLARAALSQGKNPAQVAFNLAKRYGYKTEAPKPATQPQASVERIETVKKGQETASKTLKGGATETQASVQKLIDAKGEDFDKLWKEMFD